MAFPREKAISVGRRIALLIVVGATVMATGIALVARSLSEDVAYLDYSRRFVVAPTEALPAVLEQTSTLEAEVELGRRAGQALPRSKLERTIEQLDRFTRRYRDEWMPAHKVNQDADRFRRELARTNTLFLLDEERRTMSTLESDAARLRQAVPRAAEPEATSEILDASRDVSKALRSLLVLNVRFMDVDHNARKLRTHDALVNLVMTGVGALIMTVLLGLHIQSAIGPRLATMARKVRKFQETGEFIRTPNPGHDEIGVLSNALDVGFSAIRERDRERERFLAVAAHELKTPVTSIRGFAEVALANADPALRTRALEVIRRQAHRFDRLAQDLFLAASARQGRLAFEPAAAEAGAIVQKVLNELEQERSRFDASTRTVHFLGDGELIGHALWQMFSCAAAAAALQSPIGVRCAREGELVVFEVEIRKPTMSRDDVERAFMPFSSVQYEGVGPRYACGLYLSREIAKLHGGNVDTRCTPDDAIVLRMALPA